MVRALELATAVKGRTNPNPAVGAVLVRDGRIVGDGATQPYGQPHAEPVALAAAGAAARGATLYVTLEPCSHHGRTPPCTDAVIASGVSEVHLATLDPNPLVAGRGLAALQAAGIRTFVGDGAAAARDLNEDFGRWITTHRPLVIAKFACSLDGKIATRSGDSRWITGAAARARVHQLRDRVDAILVGVNTVLADDPQLTTRLDGTGQPGWTGRAPRHPLRIVVDSQARTPPAARLLGGDTPGQSLIVTTLEASPERRAALAGTGAEVLCLAADRHGRVALGALLDELGRRRLISVLVEGGATVLGAFFDTGLVDLVMAYLAPVVIGGRDAPAAVGGAGPAALTGAHRLLAPQVRQEGVDTLVSGYLRRVPWPENER